MSKIVKYVAIIEELTGRIMNVEFPQATLPPEGSKDGFETVHITEDNMPVDFMQQGVSLLEFNWNGVSFDHVGKPPNRFATYNGTEWAWDAELLLGDVRKIRNAKLTATDWTQVPDAPLSDEQKLAWQEYRQALRDIMDSVDGISSVDDVAWPTQP